MFRLFYRTKIDGLIKVRILEFRFRNLLKLLSVKIDFCVFCAFLRLYQNNNHQEKIITGIFKNMLVSNFNQFYNSYLIL